jgi:hypothetical protein
VMTRQERRQAARKRSDAMLTTRRQMSDESSLFAYGRQEEAR